jgi:hypothetical protein
MKKIAFSDVERTDVNFHVISLFVRHVGVVQIHIVQVPELFLWVISFHRAMPETNIQTRTRQ